MPNRSTGRRSRPARGAATELQPAAAPPSDATPTRDGAPGGRDARGRFAVGNHLGREWQPGQSGNPSGRPSSFGELRGLLQEIGNEEITGHPQQWTQLERMIRQMFFSKNATDHQNVLEFGWGKVPSEHQISGNVGLYDPSTARAELARRLARVAATERDADVP